MSRWEALRGAGYASVLLWINAYVCRNWFFNPTAQMNSIHGYWAALARLGDGWLHTTWWPFWDFGIPFEFTSAPLVPAMTAVVAGLRNGRHLMALQTVSAVFYCAAPVSLFLMAWLLTRAPGYSFLAGLFYSLLSPAKLLVPDGPFAWANVLNPHRFMLQAAWDETPRCAALTFLLLFVLFLARWIEERRRVYGAAAAVSLALAMLASPFAALSAVIAALCLLSALQPENWRRNLLMTSCLCLLAYALSARFLPPSLWAAIAAASAAHEPWHPGFGMLKVVAAVAVVWLTLLHFLRRWSVDWRVQFFALLAFAFSCGPILAMWVGWQFLPQPQRFRIEMEAAAALAVVFGLRPLLERLPRSAKAVLVFSALALAGEQVVNQRRLAKDVLYPADVSKTIEYRTAQRVARELPDVRVMMPGSIAHWANAFTGVAQFSGSEGTMAYSQTQQRAMTAIYEEDARVSLAWLKAYGAAAVVVSGPASREHWKPFAHPEKFDGVLPPLWSEEGVTVYRVPQRIPSLAHVVPESALVLRTPVNAADTTELDRYVAALDDAAVPEAAFAWQGRNRARLQAITSPGRAISVQVSYHPGWHAAINGRGVDVHRDGLGLMWLRPDVAGEATVEMHYDGGWELRLCWWLSVAAMLGTGFWLWRGKVL